MPFGGLYATYHLLGGTRNNHWTKDGCVSILWTLDLSTWDFQLPRSFRRDQCQHCDDGFTEAWKDFFHNIFPAQKFQLVVNWCLGLVNWCLGLVNWCLGLASWCLGARWFGFRWDPRKWKGIATWGHPDSNLKPPIYHELKVDYFSVSMWGFKGKVIK